MGKALFSEIFGTFVSADIAGIFNKCKIVRCSLETDERTLSLVLTSENYITRENHLQLSDALILALRLTDCSVLCVFAETALDSTACADIISEIKVKNAALNGYFNGAKFEFTDGNVGITLKYGGFNKISESGFESSFKNIVKTRFGKEITVSFAGQLD